MDSRNAIAMIEADGWYLVRVKGSHHQFKHPTKGAGNGKASTERHTVTNTEKHQNRRGSKPLLEVYMLYPVAIDKGDSSFGVRVPDIPAVSLAVKIIRTRSKAYVKRSRHTSNYWLKMARAFPKQRPSKTGYLIRSTPVRYGPQLTWI